jgi:hypothetical protein
MGHFMKPIKLIPLEIHECFTFVQYLNVKKIPHYHIYAGGKISIVEAIKIKRLGVGNGYPDFCIPIARKNYNSLYVEMKRKKGGVLSETQKEKINELNKNGFLAVVAHGCDEAIKIVENYLSV